MLHQTGQLNGQLIQPGVFFCEKLCVKVLFFAHRGHLKALKVCDLKFVYL
jgi:hypothetical protein